MIKRVLCLTLILLITFLCPVLAQFYDPVRDRFYGYKDQPRPWTERPAVPANTLWGFVYAPGTSHEKSGAIELVPDGRIRVWLGSSDLSPQRIEVVPGDDRLSGTTVQPNSDVEKIIYAPYSWGYDDHGILTFYAGKDGERLRVAWKLYRISYDPDQDHLMFSGYGPTDGAADMVSIIYSGLIER